MSLASPTLPMTPSHPSHPSHPSQQQDNSIDHHHNRSTRKIGKACELCRRRKIRCSGEQPCHHCRAHPERCEYRLKARIRPSIRASSAVADPGGANGSRDPQDVAMTDANTKPADDDVSEKSSCARTEVYHSVSAKHDSPQSTDSSQLFYGPSSNFAFLQQLHRGIILSGSNSDRCRASRRLGSNGNVLEAGAGLDMFMQRPIFFGTPSLAEGAFSLQMLSRSLAEEFLSSFNRTTMLAFPFVSISSDLFDDMLEMFEPSSSSSNATYQLHAQYSPQRVVVFLAVLAVGAQCTSHTKLAEELFVYARREAIPYEDTVTLPMIQFSLLLAEYQINMARCNAAWLLVGNAARKAFALGLHSASAGALGKSQRLAGDDERETTVWALYFVDVCVAFRIFDFDNYDSETYSSRLTLSTQMAFSHDWQEVDGEGGRHLVAKTRQPARCQHALSPGLAPRKGVRLHVLSQDRLAAPASRHGKGFPRAARAMRRGLWHWVVNTATPQRPRRHLPARHSDGSQHLVSRRHVDVAPFSCSRGRRGIKQELRRCRNLARGSVQACYPRRTGCHSLPR
jgi:hypothetical protein